MTKLGTIGAAIRRHRPVVAGIIAALVVAAGGIAASLALRSRSTAGQTACKSSSTGHDQQRTRHAECPFIARVEREGKARQEQLSSPEAQAQRIRSQTAFHDLSPSASQALMRRDFSSLLHGTNPARTVARTGRLLRYVGVSHAIVRSAANRTEMVSSTMPLVTSAGRGPKRAVDLSLRSDGQRFIATNPLERVSISRAASGGVSIGPNGVKLVSKGAASTGAVLGDAVFFHGVGPDEDATVTPTIRGAEFSTVLRSKLSPEQIGYRVVLPSGATLVARDGGAAVERSGRVLASIPAPTAVDAQHAGVPVYMRVRGDELTLSVPHKSLSVAYPVMVDPKVITYGVTSTTPNWEFIAERGEVLLGPRRPEIEGAGPGILVAPAADWGSGRDPETVEEPWYHAQSEWQWLPHFGGKIRETVFEGISLTTETEHSGRFAYRIGTCGGGINAVYGLPPSSLACNNIGAENSISWVCAPCWTTIGLEVEVPNQNGGEVISTTSATTLSVEAMTIVQDRRQHRRRGPRRSELLGSTNEADPNRTRSCGGDPVDCATGNFTETQTDFSTPGRGVGLDLTRTYNAQAAASEESHGPFGYGWSWSFGASLLLSTGSDEGVATETKTVRQGNGSTVVYSNFSGETPTTAPGVEATLERSGGSYLFKLPSQTLFTFDGSGHLTGETDRNGNATTVAEEPCDGGEGGGGVAAVRMRYADYTTEDVSSEPERTCRIVVTDPAGRKITLYLNSEGLAERATDPMGHTVTYGYEGGNLTSVTYPGETSPRWRFHYDSQHRMNEVIDGKGHATTNSYDSADRVTEQTDRRGDTRHFEYEETGAPIEGAHYGAVETKEEEELPEVAEAEEEELRALLYVGEEPPPPPGSMTTITDDASHAVTVEHFDAGLELQSITRGYGTANATTESHEYDSAGAPVKTTDGNGHTSEYTYDSSGNCTSQKDPDGDETKWEYDGKHDVIATTNPNSEHTTIERDSHGNALKVSRPAPGGTQSTEYGYDSYGELTSMTDPLEHVWKYEYDGHGDRIAEVDPEGNKRTFAFNPDSQEISSTSPRGNASGADPGKYTTIIERDAQGRVVRVIEPLE